MNLDGESSKPATRSVDVWRRSCKRAQSVVSSNWHPGSAARVTAVSDPAAGLLDEIETQLGAAVDELRSLAAGLHPRLLTEHRLVGALEVLAARCPIPVQLVTSEQRLPTEVEAAVYYLCSEALANIAKHAAASRASIAVSVGDDRVVVEVGDDGVGGADPTAGSGLRNLIDRVEALGGTLVVADDRGTCLVAKLPLGDEA